MNAASCYTTLLVTMPVGILQIALSICNIMPHNLVEAHCYGIRKGSGHVLSNHVAVNG